MQANRHQVRIDALIDAAQDIRCFRISRVDGEPFDAYEPGAHIDVTAPSGITRQYSLCGNPDERRSYLFAVKKETHSRGGSRSLHDDVSVGAELSIGAPRNLFRLTDAASEHVLIAAGIGITPLLSMAYALNRRGARYRLHYFARSRDHAAFVDELSAEPFASHVTFHYGVEPDALAAELGRCMESIDLSAHVYTCGPGPFMDAVVAAAVTRVPEDAIHLERFAAEPSAAVTAADDAAAKGFEVRLQRSGQSVRVAPDTSIVDALAKIGIEVDTSCGEGVCGTCMVPVLDGEPDHRDHCLSKAERASNTVICCCVSRARSPVLVLDL
ncbi:ferredoxin [Burkholderia anthina]|uniref:PDR/VanB family oxidoreductase n=1 Tax=Burkholderia TaxID=32008 RepID=UPI00075C715A|nr:MULTISPECIES: PDR/VanB family oxidoreductase [Burkholderia]KVH08721.1 ferredoxin [Burkholderia anthina]KVH10694.1 ferredoxin [Burkholderia anthina]KVM86565.1 ferredoxin [Burkholderia anthina]KVX35935.1 ferredoxin [Burkholderia anthina]MCA8107066.1 PDR/VanB family oxidoreductase [Burkholderia sp. AU36459]